MLNCSNSHYGGARLAQPQRVGLRRHSSPMRHSGLLRLGQPRSAIMRIAGSTAPGIRVVQGQPSWRLASKEVEAFVTEMGGHVGPVTFDRQGRKIRPYSVAPWAEEPVDRSLPPIIRALRGDFFCLPFGGNATPFGGEKHPVHGETANARWRLESLEAKGGRTCLHLSLRTKVRPGRVDKRIWLDGRRECRLFAARGVGNERPHEPGPPCHDQVSRCAGQRADFHEPVCVWAGRAGGPSSFPSKAVTRG